MLNYQLTSTFASGEDGTNQNTLDQTLAGNLFFNPVASFANQQHHLVSPMQFNTENYNSASTYPPISQSHLSEYVETAPELYLSRPLVLAENADIPAGYPVMLGLNLGERINISSSEKDFDRHLWRITKISDYSPMNLIRCQADGCMANLYGAKNYYRRHKVCDFHSKAAAVFTGGQTQRFCQQCSRFHLVSEFDQEKRSCRKRLADHNRRRRKVLSQQNEQEQFQNMESPSSESIVVSSPFNALKCINPKHHATTTTGSVSSRIRM